MPNKYIIHGATYCGDGTTSAEATSAGGVGALNSIVYFEGTAWPSPAVLAAGDVVYIRSLDAAGNPITITKTAAFTIGYTAGTEAAPITFVIDAGTVWSGISGTITYTMTSATAWTLRNFNNIIAKNHNLIIRNTNTALGNITWLAVGNTATDSVKFDCSATMTSTGPNATFAGGTHSNMWLVQGAFTYFVVGNGTSGTDTVLENPKIEVKGPPFFTTGTAIFSVSNGHSGGITVFGGSVSGGSLTTTVLITAVPPCGTFNSFGLAVPAAVPISNATLYTSRAKTVVNGSDAALGNVVYDYQCEYSSRFDGFYPTLNARLETREATAWAYRLHTYRSSQQSPAKITTSKIWTQTAAAQKITLELLWPTTGTSTLPTPTSDLVWMTIQYVNSSGVTVTQTSRAFPGATLATSMAGWSATTYGATAFDKRKIEITTSDAIKQDTSVLASLFVIPKANNAAPLDIIIVCPDITFTTP